MRSRILEGQTVLVTGAGGGIGLTIAKRFSEEGAFVVATDVQSQIETVCSDSSGLHPFACDVTDEQQVRDAVSYATAVAGRLDVVVNAAGIVRIDDVAQIHDVDWDATFDVNLKGTMRVCRAAIPVMEGASYGSIVNIASVAAFNASPGMASYAASKAGVVALTRSMAHRYGSNGIRSNCICPGWVRTPMSEGEMRDNAKANGTSVETEFALLTRRISLGRVGEPHEIASCALFLASEESSFVSGAVLIADGGARSAAARPA